MSIMSLEWPARQAAFVTGAASGIGLGIARVLVSAGVKVALADIDGAGIADVAEELTDAGGTVRGVQLDVTNAEEWSAAADEAEQALGPISILFNNAGVTGGGTLDQTQLDVWRWIYRVNIESQFIGVSTFLPRFRRHGGRAHIVNTASMAGLVPVTGLGAYSSSKFASVGFSMVLRDELKLQSPEISVSVLCPGSVATRIARNGAEGEARLLGTKPNDAAIQANSERGAKGADPNRVGEQVLRAIQQRQFLIFTHRDWVPLVERVQTEVAEALGACDYRYGPDLAAQALLSGASPIAT